MAPKIVTSFFLFVVVLTPVIYGAPPDRSAKPSPSPPLSEILHGDDICKTANPLLKSKSLKDCENYKMSALNETSINHGVYICLTIYDRFFHICHSGTVGEDISHLVNVTLFDTEVTKKMDDVLRTCEAFKTLIPSTWSRTKEYAGTLMKMTQNDPEQCVSACKQEGKPSSAKPMCAALQVLDEQLKKLEPFKKDIKSVSESNPKSVVNPTGEATKTGETTNHDQGEQNSGNPSAVEAPVTPETPVKNPAPKASAQKDPAPAAKPPPTENIQTTVKASPKVVVAPKKAEAKADDVNKSEQPAKAKETDKKKGPAKFPDAEAAAEKVDAQAQAPPKGDDGQDPIDKPSAEDGTLDDRDDEAVGKMPEETYDEDRGGVDQQHDPKDANMGEDDDHEEGAVGEEVPAPPVAGVQSDSQKQQNIPIARIDNTAEEDSHLFGYFTAFAALFICLLIAYHHKHKILAILLEGRRSRVGRSRRRPSTANYRKLDCNLEEAVTSQCSSNVTHVIY